MVMLTHFIYSKKTGVIFAYVPKVACTNWKCILRYLDGHKDYLNTQIAHDRNRSGLAYLSTFPNAEVLLKDTTVPKLTCVRNPYTRILSAYLNKIKPFVFDNASIDWDPYFYKVFQHIDAYRKTNCKDTETVTFSCFLDWLEGAGDPLTQNEHWISQTSILGSGEVTFDHIGRIENIGEDVPILLQRMGCDIPFPSQRDVQFPPTHADDLINKYYTEANFEQVARIYAADLKLFNYRRMNNF